MERNYSVFLGNVGSCMDRYCPEYAKPFSIEELFDRVKTIPLLSAVDLVMTQDLIAQKDVVRECVKRTGLKVASVAVDTFANVPVSSITSLDNIDFKSVPFISVLFSSFKSGMPARLP